MQHRYGSVRVTSRRLTLAAILLLSGALGACSNDNNDNGGGLPSSTAYVGLVASTDGQTGPLDITFASAVAAPPIGQEPGTGPSLSSGAPVAATGTVGYGSSAPVAISGTINGGTLDMTSEDGWVLHGSLLDGHITGTFTAPDGSTGSLSAVSSTAGSPALAFCGYFEGTDLTNDPPSVESGTFSAVVAGTVVLGSAVGDGGTVFDFAGTATATTFTINQTTPEGRLAATGTYDGNGTEGTYDTYAGTLHAGTGGFVGYICGSPL